MNIPWQVLAVGLIVTLSAVASAQEPTSVPTTESPAVEGVEAVDLNTPPVRLEDADGAVCALIPIYFSAGSAELSERAKVRIEHNARCIGVNEGAVLVAGNTDATGSSSYNFGVGERYASAVRQHLIELGVPEERLRTVSYGEARPVCTEFSDTCHNQNRRVELRFE